MIDDSLTVLILTAGFGSRMGPFSRLINKALIPYKDKALISHIFEKFPSNSKFVVACGHKGNQVKDYVTNVHKDKSVSFIDIPDFSEINTGPATTIRYCAKFLPTKFIWISCDTLFDFDFVNKLDHNWIAVHPVNAELGKDYCWIKRDGETVIEVCDKVVSNVAVDAFIGLMYVNDSRYIENLNRVNASETPEGFDNIDLKAHTVSSWSDFGTYEKWKQLTTAQTENSFLKPDEIFYNDNGSIVKYFADKSQVINRVKRSIVNAPCMPTNITHVNNFLIHDWVSGDILYNQITPAIFKKMVNWCEHKLWVKPDYIDTEANNTTAKVFYKDKTFTRLSQFRISNSKWNEFTIVNNQSVKLIDEYLDIINWDELCKNTEWRFIHGDLHFDNIVYNVDNDKFTCIDWRTDFAGDVYGDLYYDLAKLLGGLYLNYRDIKNKDIEYSETLDSVNITVFSVKDYSVYEDILRDWVIKNNLSWTKVQTLVPLIYLNMSPLHSEEFGKFLIALAQLYFSKIYN